MSPIKLRVKNAGMPRLIAIVLSAAAVLASCGNDTDNITPETTVQTAAETGTVTTETVDKTNIPNDNVEEIVEGMLKSEVRIENGMPRLYINDRLTIPTAYFGNTDIGTNVTEQAKLAADAGIHLHSVIYNLRFDDDYSDTKSYAYTNLDYCLNSIISADKYAKIILRVNVGAYCDPASLAEGDWRADDLISYADGSTGNLVSTASDRWAEEASARLKAIVDYIRSSEKFAPHLACIHLERGEWFEYGFRETGSDVSETNSAKFREWLKAKYTANSAFMTAWAVDYGIDKASIPSDLPNNISSDNSYPNTLMLTAPEQRYIDYLDYIGELVASRINDYAKVVKNASDGDMLVIAFYGYLFELSDCQSGHYSMQTLLNSPYIDGFAAPVSYDDRSSSASNGSVGATSAFMTVADSVVRHGKLWFSESDQRTFVNGSPDGGWLPNLTSLEDIYNVHRREVGACMVHGTGAMWAMDLMGTGWLADSSIWKNLDSLNMISAQYISGQTGQPEFDAVFIVDEEAESIAGQPSYNVSRRLLADTRLEAYRAGISFAFAELDDVIAGKFDDAKLYVFMNPYRLSDGDVKALSDLLHRDGRTAVFMYGFGALSEESMKQLTGMEISVSASGNTNVKLTEEGKNAGFVKPSYVQTVTPRYSADGGQTTDYAAYTGNGGSAFAMYDGGDWKSVFIGATILDRQNIRAICRLAGVNIISKSNDVVVANDELIVYTASDAGEKTLSFGRTVNVNDCFAEKTYEGVSELSVSMEKGETRYFFITEP